jgi:hypothetical protein
MMGDWRSGQELLDQFDLDLRTDLGRAWKTFGRSLVQAMSSKCDLLEAELLHHQQGHAGPNSASPRSIRTIDPSLLASPDTDGLSSCMTACPSAASTLIPARWARGPLLHLWALGYRRDELAALLEALPPALLNPLSCALDSFDALDAHRRAALRVAHGAIAAAAGSSGAGSEAEDGGAGDPGALWEAEAEAGFLSVGYDGATGRRLCVGLNTRQAELMGARRGEVLQRLAEHAVPLPAPHADVLACLFHELDRPAQVCRCEPLGGQTRSNRATEPPSFPTVTPLPRESARSRIFSHALAEDNLLCPLPRGSCRTPPPATKAHPPGSVPVPVQ